MRVRGGGSWTCVSVSVSVSVAEGLCWLAVVLVVNLKISRQIRVPIGGGHNSQPVYRVPLTLPSLKQHLPR